MAQSPVKVREDYRGLTGPQKAAILMLSLGEDATVKLFQHMDEDEIKEVSQTMANLGMVGSTVIERLFVDFTEQISSTTSLTGSFEST
jgi:flagellar motor switch protein FliG